jgi:hypothetical protein
MQKCANLVKGIGSILHVLLKKLLEKICRKNYKNHFRGNNYEVCTAAARCFPNTCSLEVMVLENVNLSSDRICRPQLWSNETDSDFCHQLPTYTVSSVYFNYALISYVH